MNGDGAKALEAARARRAEMLARGEQIVRLDPVEKARRKPTSLRLAITAMCWQCFGGGADPNTRASIRGCTSPDCALYPVRPYQRRASSAAPKPEQAA